MALQPSSVLPVRERGRIRVNDDGVDENYDDDGDDDDILERYFFFYLFTCCRFIYDGLDTSETVLRNGRKTSEKCNGTHVEGSSLA